MILTDSIRSVLRKLHPNRDYIIGQDSGIYWRETDPPENGAEAPDWFYIGGVPASLNGEMRRSYVLPLELVPPVIAIEFAIGDGSEERDNTPLSAIEQLKRAKPGKFWVYEQIIKIAYYGIFEIDSEKLEVYKLVDGSYQKMQPNNNERYLIEPLQVELGLWQGSYHNISDEFWVRWWDTNGNLLLTGWERVEKYERQCLEAEQRIEAAKKAQQEEIIKLFKLGFNIEQAASALSLSVQEITSILLS